MSETDYSSCVASIEITGGIFVDINVTKIKGISDSFLYGVHCERRFSIFPSPDGMSLTKLSLGGNNAIFSGPRRVRWVTSRLETGKSRIFFIFFYSVPSADSNFFYWSLSSTVGKKMEQRKESESVRWKTSHEGWPPSPKAVSYFDLKSEVKSDISGIKQTKWASFSFTSIGPVVEK